MLLSLPTLGFSRCALQLGPGASGEAKTLSRSPCGPDRLYSDSKSPFLRFSHECVRGLSLSPLLSQISTAQWLPSHAFIIRRSRPDLKRACRRGWLLPEALGKRLLKLAHLRLLDLTLRLLFLRSPVAAWGRLRQSRIISHLRLSAPSAESPVRGHSRDWDVGYCHNMQCFCNYCSKTNQ